MMEKRKILKPHLADRRDTWSDGRKEQISLMPGTPEYAEYVRDHAGIEAQDFVHDDAALDAGEDRRPDEDQVVKTEPDHVAEFADELRQAAGVTGKITTGVLTRRHVLQTEKREMFPEAKRAAEQAAARTPTKKDDESVRRFHDADDIPDPVYDDSVPEDEFLPRAMRDMM